MEVFQRLREVNLKIHPGKCAFLRKEVLYLGHIISEKGIFPDPSKSEVMRNYPVPTNADEVRRFVAFANYYRKFIPNFASITIPLNKLLKKDAKFNFTSDCVEAFEIIKNILISPKILQFPNFDEEFILRTDASGFALGAVLSNFDDKPIAYASKTLNSAEKNYSTIEKELLAIVWAIKHYRPYLFGRRFKILTDHRPLVYLFSLKEPSSRLTKFRLLLEEYNFYVEYSPGTENCTADALSRIQITSEDLKIIFIGVTTRAQTKAENEKSQNENENENDENKTVQQEIREILKPPEVGLQLIELKITKDLQEEINKVKGQKDIILGPSKILAYIPKGNCIVMVVPNDSTETRSESFGRKVRRDVQKIAGPLNLNKLYITKGELGKLSGAHPNKNDINDINMNEMRKLLKKIFEDTDITVHMLKDLIKVEDPGMKKLILNDYHVLPTSGHAGINRMMKHIKNKYFWSGMQQDVTTFIKHCEACQRNKHINAKRQPMIITTTSETSFEKVFVDLVGPLGETEEGFKYILTVQDELTKFIESIPLKNKEANSVAKGLVQQFVLKYGVPKRIASDQGTEFMNKVFEEMCKLLKIEQMFSTAYHHESIGALENTHKVLGAYLRSYVTEQHTQWDEWLPYYTFCYNTSVHSETEYTPYELVYGKQCKLPSNITNKVDPVYNYEDYVVDLKNKLQVAHRDAKEILVKKKEERKKKYDTEYKVKEYDYEIGSLVLLKNESRKKLDPIYIGPFEVIKNEGVNCKIKNNAKNMTVHKNRLKPYYIYMMTIT